MNSFADGSKFRIENGFAVYNYKSINNSYLEKALDGIPIELFYNEGPEDDGPKNTKTLIQKAAVLEKNSINLEKSSCVYKKIIKEKYLKKKTRKAKNTKTKHRYYKNFDIDNQCEICGIIGCKHEFGCKQGAQNTLDYHNMQYNEEKRIILQQLFNFRPNNYMNDPNYYDYTTWKKNSEDFDDTDEDNYDEEAIQTSRTRRLLDFRIRHLSRLNGTEFLNDEFFLHNDYLEYLNEEFF